MESSYGCKKITLENGEIVYVKKDKKKNKFYIDLLKHLGLCDLEYIYDGNYILTKQIENMVPLNTRTRNQFENTRNIIQNANLIPFYTILATLNLQDCSLKHLSNIYAVRGDKGHVLKIIDIDPCKKLNSFKTFEDFYSVLNEKICYKFYYGNEKKILENSNEEKYKEFNKIFITLWQDRQKIQSLYKYLDSEIDIDIKTYKELTGSSSLINCYIDGYKKYDINCEDDEYNYMKKIFENEFKFDHNAFLEDFLNHIWDEEGEYGGDFQRRLKKTTLKDKNEYFAWVNEIINSRIYEAVKLQIEHHNFITKYLIERVNSITNEEKEEIRKLFGEMIDFLIANYKNTEYDNNRYNYTIWKILEMKKSRLFSFIFDNGRNKRANELKFRG